LGGKDGVLGEEDAEVAVGGSGCAVVGDGAWWATGKGPDWSSDGGCEDKGSGLRSFVLEFELFVGLWLLFEDDIMI
jgi:hypothetical protein